jgi:very-short-patch-repair endonuclease
VPHAAVAPLKRGRAKSLRRTMTPAERKLWYALRAHRFVELGFRRQVPLDRYILDFVCHGRGLLVEVDGGQHFSGPHKARDEVRDHWLRSQGYRVIRLANNDVLRNLEGVIEYLLSVAASSPLPPCGGARPRMARSEGGCSVRAGGSVEDPFPGAPTIAARRGAPGLPHQGGGVEDRETRK